MPRLRIGRPHLRNRVLGLAGLHVMNRVLITRVIQVPKCFIMARKLSHDSSTEDLNAHDIKTG